MSLDVCLTIWLLKRLVQQEQHGDTRLFKSAVRIKHESLFLSLRCLLFLYFKQTSNPLILQQQGHLFVFYHSLLQLIL